MGILERLDDALRLSPAPPTAAETERAHAEIARSVVMRVSRGNVRLSQGRYYTSADLERERAEAARYDFGVDARGPVRRALRRFAGVFSG